MLKRFIGFSWIELKVYLRDPTAIFWTFLFPFLLLFIFMALYSEDNNTLPTTKLTIVESLTPGVAHVFTEELIQVLEHITLPIHIEHTSLAKDDMDIEENEIVLRFPDDFEQDFVNGKVAYINAVYDVNATETTRTVLSVIDSINNNFNIRHNLWQLNSQLKYVPIGEQEQDEILTTGQFLVTGLIGMSILSTCLFGFSVLLVQMRAEGAFKIYQVLPITALFYLVCFITSRLIVMLIFAVLFLLVADMVYDLGVNYSLNSIVQFLFVVMLGAAAFLSIGILFASRTNSVSTANGIGNLVYFPLIFLSGLFFPLSVNQEWLSNIAKVLPLNSYVEMLRGTLFSDIGLFHYADTLLLLVAWIVVSLLITQRIFVWNTKN